ncbi:MAG: M48 family metallopeptidase [Gracilimonas sp.]|uniref:M48 family metallopeptidase n=1 Tax=Gracilimonas TaxID=649462 RepID=UPI001B0C8E2A|nr:SprT family zinc-dependent metalloprotease [Gracilimonas sp.]MBO6587302.1 M48 family metallopeptidase [Gracilimonas sp.]MBO6614210.1 M48 family metallopeptidase [Gracilimonas sp.]
MAGHKLYSKSELEVSGLKVVVLRKNVKNLNLRVYPAERRVRISVPRRISDWEVATFVEDKLPWIHKHLSNYRKKPKPRPQDYTTGELHPVWGKNLELVVVERNKPPEVLVDGTKLKLFVRPGTVQQKRASVLKEWYREELKQKIPELIEKWEPEMGVKVEEFGVKLMKTRWGTCNIRARRIWLNLELAKKRPELLEYVIVHEMVHLLERLHNKRFYGFMSRFLPNWKSLKNELNGKSQISDC